MMLKLKTCKHLWNYIYMYVFKMKQKTQLTKLIRTHFVGNCAIVGDVTGMGSDNTENIWPYL